MWIALTGLVLLALRLLSLATRSACTQSSACDSDWGFVLVVGIGAIAVIIGSLYSIDKLVPGGPSASFQWLWALNPSIDNSPRSLQPQPRPTTGTSGQRDDLTGRLHRLDALREARTIAELEYAQRRAEMLREL